MNKLLHDDSWVVLANHRRSQVQVIIMQHDDGHCIFAFYLNIYRVSNGLVCHAIAIFPGILNLACESRIAGWIVHVVLQKPEQCVTNLFIVFAISCLGNSHIAELHLVTLLR